MCDYTEFPMDANDFSTNMTNAMTQNKREDKQLKDAAQLSLETGSITPLLKQELRYSILIRRVSEGKNEIEEDIRPTGPNKLTKHEIEKKQRRREQNRQAAIRFRQKNKNKGNTMIQENERLQAENEQLQRIIGNLTNEKNCLMKRIKEHFQFCNLRPLQSDLELFCRQ